MARSRGTARPLDEAESYVRGGAGSNPSHAEPTDRRNARACLEEQRLRQWAFAYFNEPQAVASPKRTPLGRGAEHEVYLDLRRNRVVKVTRKSAPASYGFGISLNSDGQGATAGEYLDRLRLHNAIFNDDVRLEGVLPLAGNTKVITSQPFIDGRGADPAQIDAYMEAKGFERLTAGTYYEPVSQVLVHDLYPRNAVLTSEGSVRAIDPAILRSTPEFARFIRQTR